jgi:tRNA-splicing ligase RtcB
MQIAQRLNHNQALEDPALAVFIAGTPKFDAYRRDLYWAQEYAALNRELMLERVKAVVKKAFKRVVRGDHRVPPQLRG